MLEVSSPLGSTALQIRHGEVKGSGILRDLENRRVVQSCLASGVESVAVAAGAKCEKNSRETTKKDSLYCETI